MLELIKKISNLESPIILTENELSECLKPKEKEALIELSILLKDKPLDQILCPECQDHFVEIQCKGKKYFGYCDKEDIGKVEIPKKDILCWSVDVNNLLSVFTKSITGDQVEVKEIVKNKLWELGRHEINKHTYRLFFTKNTKTLDHEAEIILDVNSPILFFINHRNNDLSQNLKLVPFLDLIKKVNKASLAINFKELDFYFPTKKTIDDEDDLFLDKHIVLSEDDNTLYLNKLTKGRYKNEINISPQVTRIISYLYQIKDNTDNNRTYQELANLFSSGSTKSLSNRIKEVKNICTKYKVKNIFHKNSEQKLSLNPELDCFDY